MSDAIISWILECWTLSKKEYEELPEKKKLNSLAKQLRIFVNQVKTKNGIPPESKKIAAEMAQFIESEVIKIPWDERGIAHSVALSVQYARKHLGNTTIQGSAIKGNLSRADRSRVRKLVKLKLPASGSVEQKLSQDPPYNHDIQSGRMVNGDATVD